MKVEAGFVGFDFVTVTFELSDGHIETPKWNAVGCLAFLKAIENLKSHFTGSITDLKIPLGADHVGMLVREIVLKARGEWNEPYKQEELCHCRRIPLKTVNQAIVYGCHSPQAVARKTSAGTGCGSCRPVTQTLIDYRKTG